MPMTGFRNQQDPYGLGGFGSPFKANDFMSGLNNQIPYGLLSNDFTKNAIQSGSYMPGNPGAQQGGGIFGNMLGPNGWGGLALGGLQALMGGWMGMKQYGIAKDTLKEGKRQFNKNYTAQASTINTQLEDRQRARVASNAGAYESVTPYMDKNRIKP